MMDDVAFYDRALTDSLVTEFEAANTDETDALTNDGFLRTLFQNLTDNITPLVVSFNGNPGAAPPRSWKGQAWQDGVTTLPPDANNYFSLATFRPDETGQYRRRKSQFVALHAIMLDDIGTKVALECLRLPPTWLLETSQGNHQAGYMLATPIADSRLADRLMNIIIAAGLCDRGANGPCARLARLPVAINGKPGYLVNDLPFQCCMVEWEPTRRYTVDELLEGFGLVEPVASQPSPRRQGRITEPGRNTEVHRQLSSMRGRGASDAALLAEGRRINATRCHPPMEDSEVVQIVNSVCAYPPGTAADDELPFGSEQALAEAFDAETAGVLRWSPGMDWMFNIGHCWERDDHLRRFAAAKQVCKSAASGLDNAKVAAKICAASTSHALLSLARSADGIVTPVAEWDKHPMLLNTPDAVIDLETGQAVPRDGLLFTQATRIWPQRMSTPAWDRFVSEIFGGDLEMVEFIQRMAGYVLTGSIKEQKLFFLHGTGSNGKSVFLDVLRAIGGTYSHNLPAEALMTSKHEGHPTMFASLHGKRLAISSEIEESAHWAESRIKSLTGDETLTARYMRQDFFTFPVTHKHIIAGNFKPRLKGDDFAMVRRLVLVPFAQRFEGARRDSNLPDKLRAEYPGILAWAIDGARKWAASGLAIPAAVIEASRAYMAEQNDLEQWIVECCVRDPKGEAGSSKLYESFKQWKDRNGEHAPAMRNFSQRLERMFHKKHTKTGKVFVGLMLNQSGADYAAASRGW
jgi:putative DNA primase/helicase